MDFCRQVKESIWNFKEGKESDKLESRSDLINKVNSAFWSGLGCWSLYNLIDSGLSRFFALETLTHGTGPLGFIGIHINGANPHYGGGNMGSSVGSGMY